MRWRTSSAGQAAAGSAAGRVLTAYVATPAVPGAIGTHLQGKLKGSYYINTDGSVDVTAGKLTTGSAAGDPDYLSLYFSETTGQFKSSATTPAGTVFGPG